MDNPRLAGLRRWLPAFALVGSACAINPVTGDRQLSLISEAQEIEMGRAEVAPKRINIVRVAMR